MSCHQARRRFGAALRPFFASLSVPNYRWFFWGQLITVWGSFIGAFAEVWLLVELTGSGLWVSAGAMLWAAPLLLGGAWAGTLADRFPRRRLLLVTQSCWVVTQTGLLVVVAVGAVEPWIVCAATGISGAINAVDMPARAGFLRDLVGLRGVANAVALRNVVVKVGSIGGPATAGFVIAHWGVAWSLALNALCCLAMPAVLLAIDPAALHHEPRAPRRDARLRAALRHVTGRPQLWIPLGTLALVGMLSLNFSLLVPLLAVEIAPHPGTYAAFSAALGLGALVGSLAAGAISRIGHALMAGSAAALGVVEVAVAVALSGSLPGTIVGLAVAGVLSAIFTSAVQAKLLMTAASSMQGRVMALYGVAQVGSTTIGAPVTGWIIDAWSATAGLAVSGAVALLAGGAAWVAHRLSGGRAAGAPAADERTVDER